jgi:hypothetical protein
MNDDLDEILDTLNRQPKLNKNMPKTTSLWLDRYEAKQAIEELLIKAYRNGYNDNARDCLCTGGTIPHKHLIDDGDSYDIRPNINKLLKKEEV